jgi:hypothetical protein
MLFSPRGDEWMPDEVNQLFLSVQKQVQSHMRHPFLVAQHMNQTLSQFHFEVGLAILRAAGLAENDILAILSAFLLLQQGLSIHDSVDSERGVRQQLVVLAGDYDSSKYYRMLAFRGDFALLCRLSDGIAKTNEAKMTLLSRDGKLTPATYLSLREVVEGQILHSLAEHFLGNHEPWKMYVQSFVRAYIVQTELHVKNGLRYVTFRQAYDWLSEMWDRVVSLSPLPRNDPILTSLTDYVQPLKDMLEVMKLAEGSS